MLLVALLVVTFHIYLWSINVGDVVIVVVALLFVTVKLCSINVNQGLQKADVEFLWWVVCKVIFVSNPTALLRLYCCWGCDNNIW